MVKISDLREKEIINVKDGSRVGMINDLEIDLDKGIVKAIIIPGPGRILGFFGKNNEYIIKWKDIVKIGADVILINSDPFNEFYEEDEVSNR